MRKKQNTQFWLSDDDNCKLELALAMHKPIARGAVFVEKTEKN